MTNDDRTPLPLRLLTALLMLGLAPQSARCFGPLATALHHELPARALPRALLRLRRHLRSSERRGDRSADGLQLPGCLSPLSTNGEEPRVDIEQHADGSDPDESRTQQVHGDQ
ncbi:hypothetical protein B0H03_102315 [Rathayibacter iranicus NCPPB 2253 = VKM Ac-1602]|uniref:Uncharacterized protein n=1 Tax=Rathayibacter iranicus NCPPB 2253 = VKM Ac-1602 TaxID=1328868 RepID=A0ABX5LFK4_9MICO|nr:hypothetical protein B0H03_102315 [Rathayibacter iranicus NCPPB 2253 = VKM Ac-1602]